MRKIIQQEITCPRCGGKGRIFDFAEGVCTLGITLLFGLFGPKYFKDVCPKCNGKGTVYKNTIIEEL